MALKNKEKSEYRKLNFMTVDCTVLCKLVGRAQKYELKCTTTLVGVCKNTPIRSAHTAVADILHFAFEKLTTNLQSTVYKT